MKKQTQWLYKLCMVVWISTESSMCLLKTQMCFFFWFTSCINGRQLASKYIMICGQRYLPLHEFVSILGDRCGKLLGIHLLTGSNTVNSFYVVRKPKAYKKLSHEILAAVGSSFNNLPSMNEVVANFYDLYGMERFLGTMNQLRYKLSAERSLCEDRYHLLTLHFLDISDELSTRQL